MSKYLSRHIISLFAAWLFAAAASGQVITNYMETFDAGRNGWRATPGLNLFHTNNLGNPGGVLIGQMPAAQEGLPPPPPSIEDIMADTNASAGFFTGDFTARAFPRLEFDFMIVDDIYAYGGVALWNGLSEAVYDLSLNSGQTGVWERVSIPLYDDRNWFPLSEDPDLARIFRDVKETRFFVLANAGRSVRLDNVALVERGVSINVAANPPEGGTVSGGGIYPQGEEVELTASASSGWSFAGWSDGNTNAERTVIASDGGRSYMATFQIIPVVVPTGSVALVAEPTWGGSLLGGGTFFAGSTQQVSAKASAGWSFEGWYWGATNQSTENPLAVIVPEADSLMITGRFVEVPVPEIAVEGNLIFGRVPLGPTNRLVTITNAGSAALIITNVIYPEGFSGATTGLVEAASSVQLEVTFEPLALGTNYQGQLIFQSNAQSQPLLDATGYLLASELSVIANPPEGGSVSGGGTHAWGDTVELSATASNGWSFAGWSDGLTNPVRVVIAPDGGRSYEATFQVNPVIAPTGSIALVADPAWAGSLSGGGASPPGSTQQVSAAASDGWSFEGWYWGTTNQSTDNPLAILAPEAESLVITGRFIEASMPAIAVEGDLIFGRVPPGPTNRLVTITNAGSEALIITNIMYPEGFSGATTSFVAAASSVVQMVTFEPLEPGTNYQGQLIFQSNARNEPALDASGRLIAGTLTLTANPPEGGTVTGGGTYTVGSTQAISAVAAEGWTFSGWSDGNTNAVRKVVVIDDVLNFTATFQLIPVVVPTVSIALVAEPAWAGSFLGGGTFFAGSTQQISAEASDGWTFDGWSWDATNQSSNNPLAVIVPEMGSLIITGRFVEALLSEIAVTGDLFFGRVPLGPTNRLITITNAGAASLIITNIVYPEGFSGATTGFVEAASSARLAVTFNPVELGRNYLGQLIFQSNARIQPVLETSGNLLASELTVTANPSGGGTVSGGGIFPLGSTQQISAVAAEGWSFVGWSDDRGRSHAEANLSVTLLATSVTYTASFTNTPEDSVVLHVRSINPAIGVNIEGTLPGFTDYVRVVPTGTNVTLIAPAAVGSGAYRKRFVDWTGSLNSATQQITFTISSNMVLTANYTNETITYQNSGAVTFPLNYSNRTIAVFVFDNQEQNYISLLEPAEAPASITFSGVQPGRWYWLVVMLFDEASEAWAVDHGSWFRREQEE